MTKHYVFNLDPSAEYDWDRCTLRDPITAERPELANLVAEAVDQQAGSYLIAINIEVQVLEQVPVAQVKQVALAASNASTVPAHSQHRGMVA